MTKNEDIYFSAGGIQVGSVSNYCVSYLGSNLATCQQSNTNRIRNGIKYEMNLVFFSVNARQGMGRREREGGFPKTDATTILADEQKGVFRVLDIGRPRPAGILLPQKIT